MEHDTIKVSNLTRSWVEVSQVRMASLYTKPSRFKRKVWNDEFIQCHHEGTVHSWLHLQPRTNYLRKTAVFMWDSALPESCNFYFSAVFC